MANVKVKCIKNTQIFYNDKGLFKVLVFFSGQEYEIDEMVYKMKPDAFEPLMTKQLEESLEPTTTTEEPVEPDVSKVEPQLESHEQTQESHEPETIVEEEKSFEPDVEKVEAQLEPREQVEENLEPSVSTEESFEPDVSNTETPSESKTVEVVENKQDEQQTVSKKRRKSSK